MTGEGMEDFFNAVEEARKEWETSEDLPFHSEFKIENVLTVNINLNWINW